MIVITEVLGIITIVSTLLACGAVLLLEKHTAKLKVAVETDINLSEGLLKKQIELEHEIMKIKNELKHKQFQIDTLFLRL